MQSPYERRDARRIAEHKARPGAPWLRGDPPGRAPRQVQRIEAGLEPDIGHVGGVEPVFVHGPREDHPLARRALGQGGAVEERDPRSVPTLAAGLQEQPAGLGAASTASRLVLL